MYELSWLLNKEKNKSIISVLPHEKRLLSAFHIRQRTVAAPEDVGSVVIRLLTFSCSCSGSAPEDIFTASALVDPLTSFRDQLGRGCDSIFSLFLCIPGKLKATIIFLGAEDELSNLSGTLNILDDLNSCVVINSCLTFVLIHLRLRSHKRRKRRRRGVLTRGRKS